MPNVIGVDLASVSDFTAVAALRVSDEPPRNHFCGHLDRWQAPYPETVAKVAGLARAPALRDAVVVADATGVGTPVVDMLREALPGRTVIGVTITAGSVPTRGATPWDVRVPKKVLVSTAQVLLSSRRLTWPKELPHLRALQDELQNFRVKITAHANETFEAWREKDHDDLVLALALAAWVGEALPPPVPDLDDVVLNVRDKEAGSDPLQYLPMQSCLSVE